MPYGIVGCFFSANLSCDFNVCPKKVVVYKYITAILFKEQIVRLQDDFSSYAIINTVVSWDIEIMVCA